MASPRTVSTEYPRPGGAAATRPQKIRAAKVPRGIRAPRARFLKRPGARAPPAAPRAPGAPRAPPRRRPKRRRRGCPGARPERFASRTTSRGRSVVAAVAPRPALGISTWHGAATTRPRTMQVRAVRATVNVAFSPRPVGRSSPPPPRRRGPFASVVLYASDDLARRRGGAVTRSFLAFSQRSDSHGSSTSRAAASPRPRRALHVFRFRQPSSKKNETSRETTARPRASGAAAGAGRHGSTGPAPGPCSPERSRPPAGRRRSGKRRTS